MNIVNKMLATGVWVLVVCGLALSVQASSLVLKNGRVVPGKTIEWREATHDYLVNNEGASVPIPEDQVAKLNIDKPAEIDQAKGLMGSHQYSQAISTLDGVARKYKKQLWDVEALKLQAQCFVEMNEPKKAAATMDALFAAGGAMTPALQMTYWKALQKSGDTKRLYRELSRTIGAGAPEMVATAYLLRASAYLQEGDEDAALADYLKIVTLLKSEKAAQPEALYNAANLLDKVKDPRAAELRKTLMQDYKTSEFAAKLAPVVK